MTHPTLTVTLLSRNRRTAISCLVLAIGILSGMCVCGLAAESDLEFRAAKTEFSKQFRKKGPKEKLQAPDDQIQAIEAIQEFPKMETVDLMIKMAIFDRPPEVSLAAHKAIQKMAQDQATATAMLGEIKRNLNRKPPANAKNTKGPLPVDIVPVLLQGLATTSDPTIQEQFLTTLDQFLDSPTGTLLLPILVIDNFALQGDEDALRAITLFSRSKMFDKKFGYQRCIVQAMFKLKQKEAVKFLIDMIPRAEGLIQHDVIVYLSKITKQSFREDHRSWVDWWSKSETQFKFPSVLPVVGDDPLPDAADKLAAIDDKQPQKRLEGGRVRNEAVYYGMQIRAKRIVFVLDTSGSMEGAPIEAAKKELLAVIAKLPESVSFDVVMFDSQITTWQRELVPATAENKELASDAVRAKPLGAATASFAALKEAFRLEPEAIYFLSDGEPTDGRADAIVNTILLTNKTRRVSIHTIGVVADLSGKVANPLAGLLGIGSRGDGLTSFMKPLAEANYGSFRLVK